MPASTWETIHRLPDGSFNGSSRLIGGVGNCGHASSYCKPRDGSVILDDQDATIGSISVMDVSSEKELREWLAKELPATGDVWRTVEDMHCKNLGNSTSPQSFLKNGTFNTPRHNTALPPLANIGRKWISD